MLEAGDTLLDYGCGRGDDVRHLQRRGFDAVGWDPVYAPAAPRRSSAVVNLGYVLNVIEDPHERLQTLKEAWNLAEKAMVVAALVAVDTATRAIPYGDGYLTSRGTFQKVYGQRELEDWLRDALDVEPVALGLGIFAVAKSPTVRARLFARRFHRRAELRSPEVAQAVFRDNERVLQPLLEFVGAHGRLPGKREEGQFPEIAERFGSVGRAGRLLRQALDDAYWEQAVRAARDNLLEYVALSRFGRRPRFSELPQDLRDDIRAHFGSYSECTRQADELLFSLGDVRVLRRAAAEAGIGKRLPFELYVHVDFVDKLPIELRLYEGCARRYLGGVEGADLIKLRLERPVVSYLTYTRFWKDPHPVLERSLQVDLKSFRVRIDDYSQRANPPILHRKELFISEDHPRHALFAKLTRREERLGLYDDPSRIGTRQGWEAVLEAHGVIHRGHRVVKRKDSDDHP